MAARKPEDLIAEAPAKDPRKIIREMRNALNKDDEDKLTWNLADDDSPTHVKDYISTGSTLLDYVISNRADGGIPCGKLTEIAGEESTGKSLLCAHIIANTQRKNGIAVYIDSENAANPGFMRQVGVDLESLIYVQPGTIERAFETIEGVIKTLRAKNGKVPVTILWDSLAGTPPQAEIEGDYDPNSRIGLGAKAMSKGLRKITDLIGKERITLVFTNQLKMNPGAGQYGDPWVVPYGKAVPYHASVRIRLNSSTKLKDANGNVYGVKTRAKCIKTRLGPGHRTSVFEIHFDIGVDDIGSWFVYLHEEAKLIEKRGGWCYIDTGGPKPIQFREKEWRKLVADDAGVREWAQRALKERLTVVYKPLEEREGIEVGPDDDYPVTPIPLKKLITVESFELDPGTLTP